MILQEKFKNWEVILASQSPRRRELLKGLDIPFTSIGLNVDETYDSQLKGKKITEFLCKQKANGFGVLQQRQLLITSDTIVWFDNTPLEKPTTTEEAKVMLTQLSGKTHEVITSVGVFSAEKEIIFTDTTKVTFGKLDKDEISYYVNTYQPMDKAGSYGVQEWIGYIGVEKICGSYYTVMGLPLFKLYNVLKVF